MATPDAILATSALHIAIIDYVALDALKGVPNLYQETLKVVQDKIGRMQQLRTQAELTSANLKVFGDLAHGLKSGICMIGCTRLAHVCYQLGTVLLLIAC
jgi:HPt (histidine-containing phosphotransfer) domain-containing protein